MEEKIELYKDSSFQIRYEDRSFEIQLLIDPLLRCFPYPLSYYEKKTDRELKALYKKWLGSMGEIATDAYRRAVNGVIKQEEQKESKKALQDEQLSFF